MAQLRARAYDFDMRCIAAMAVALVGCGGPYGTDGAPDGGVADTDAPRDTTPATVDTGTFADSSTPLDTATPAKATDYGMPPSAGAPKLFGPAQVYEAARDSKDNVVVSAAFGFETNLGGGNLSGGSVTTAVAKYDRDGAHVWSHSFRTEEGLPHGLAVDGAGDVIVGTSFVGKVQIGGTLHTAAAVYAGAIIKFDADGKYVAAKIVDAKNAYPLAIATDGTNNVVAVGRIEAPTDFGGGVLTPSMNDGFVLKLSPTLGHVWSRRFGGPDNDMATAVVSSAAGITVGGFFRGTMESGAGGMLTSKGEADAFLMRLDADGKVVWTKQYGGANRDEIVTMVSDSDGSLVVVGGFRGETDLGGGPLKAECPTCNAVFIARFGSSGEHLVSRAVGGRARFGLLRAVPRPGGRTFFVGYAFDGTVDFGLGPHTVGEDGAGLIADLGSDLKAVWSRSAPSVLASAAVPFADSVVIAGVMKGTFPWSSPTVTATKTSLFLARLTP